MNWGEFVDEVGRAVRIAAPPSRVVSLVPSLTETLYDLGAGDRVVGVTDWCGPALPDGVEPVRVGGGVQPAHRDRARPGTGAGTRRPGGEQPG